MFNISAVLHLSSGIWEWIPHSQHQKMKLRNNGFDEICITIFSLLCLIIVMHKVKNIANIDVELNLKYDGQY